MPTIRHGHVYVHLNYKLQPDGTRKRIGDYQHRIVWREAHGEIPPGYHIHHRNGDRTDNRLENLELMSWRQHGKIHGPESRGKGGRWALKHDACVECGGTERPHQGRGLCRACYQRLRWHEPDKKWSDGDRRFGWTR